MNLTETIKAAGIVGAGAPDSRRMSSWTPRRSA